MSDADVVQNAEAVYGEIRKVVDHQVSVAGGLDTKAGAVLTVLGAVAALVAPRVRVSTVEQLVVGTVTFTVVVLLAAFILAALWPRDFSYGADPPALAGSAETYERASVALAMAEALSEAWRQNDATLDRKHYWYSLALFCLFLLVICAGAIVVVGGAGDVGTTGT